MLLRLQLLVILKKTKQNKQDEGYTLIELLVVIIIVGILSAIALPSMLNQSAKARAVEAKQYLSSIAKAQQAYYLENGRFVSDAKEIGLLGLGIPVSTNNFNYSLAPINENKGVVAIAKPNNNASLKGYISGVGLIYPAGATELATMSVLCESQDVGTPAQQLSPVNVQVTTGTPGGSGGSIECAGQTIPSK